LKHLETLWLDDGQVFVQVALSENVGKSTKSQKKTSHHFPTEVAIKWGYTVYGIPMYSRYSQFSCTMWTDFWIIRSGMSWIAAIGL